MLTTKHTLFPLHLTALILCTVLSCSKPGATPSAAAETSATTNEYTVPADVEYATADSIEVVRLLADTTKTTPLDYARYFMGRPYVAYTLDGYYNRGARPEDEHLVVNLREFDCLTLLETCNALAMVRAEHVDSEGRPTDIEASAPGRSWSEYCHRLEELRYFGGHEDGYLSRIHYLSMSVADHLQRGTIEEVALPEALTRQRTTTIDFMTKHPQSYFALKNNPSLVDSLAALERRYSGQQMRFLPQEKCGLPHAQLSAIHDGDIVYIVTSRAGLDYSHQGFAFWDKDGRLHMLHASSAKKKVIADPLPLDAYLKGIQSNIGVRIFRLKR